MSTILYDTTSATDIAKVQGTLAGIQAGNASVTGVGTAATSIYNQAGYYALQDTDTGLISLQKLGEESLFTGSWYDQTSGTTFDFSYDGTGITASSTDSTDDDDDDDSGLQSYLFDNGRTTTSGSSGNSSSSSSSDDDDSTTITTTQGTTITSGDYVTDDDGNVIELTQEDLEEMVDAGIYDNLADALSVTLAAGYYVSDETQAALGLYSDDDEEKIRLMMENYGLSREDAIASLDGVIADSDTLSNVSSLQGQLDDVQDEQGVIGKAWNAIKNFFNAGVSSEDCEYAIEQYEAGEISYEEASAVISEYSSKQESATNTIKTGATVVAGLAAGALTAGLGGPISGIVISAGVGAATGAATKTGLGVLENATNEVEGDETEDVASDLVSGAVTGAIAGVAGRGIKSVADKVTGKGATKAAEKTGEKAAADAAEGAAEKTGEKAAADAAEKAATSTAEAATSTAEAATSTAEKAATSTAEAAAKTTSKNPFKKLASAVTGLFKKKA